MQKKTKKQKQTKKNQTKTQTKKIDQYTKECV